MAGEFPRPSRRLTGPAPAFGLRAETEGIFIPRQIAGAEESSNPAFLP
jgi:hypothetical protein